MTPHFLFDFETLGQNVFQCPILDCSYVVFDWDRFLGDDPYTFGELVSTVKTDKVSVEDQVKNHGCKIERSSVEWWSTQGPEARSKIKPQPDDITLVEFFENVVSYLSDKKVKFWWSRSNTFDPVILARIAYNLGRMAEVDRVLPYWTVRDTRTFIDAKSDFKPRFNSFTPIKDEDRWKEIFHKHDSSHDVAADVLRLQTLTRIERDLPVPE